MTTAKTSLRNRTMILSFSLLLALSALAAGRIIYVDADAGGANKGSSWTDAYNCLQDALANANAGSKPVEVRVAQGTYKPDRGLAVTAGSRDATFSLLNGVTVAGGYAGSGSPDPNARDIAMYPTILSGDLKGDDADIAGSRDDNSYHVVTCMASNATAILDGCTITAGNATGGSKPGSGGGIYNENASPTIRDCTIRANRAYANEVAQGAGLFNDKGNPTLINCTFFDNLIDVGIRDHGSGNGAGLYSASGNPVLTNCAFIKNVAAGNSAGAAYITGGNPTLTDCTFEQNSARTYGGGLRFSEGTATLEGCGFVKNLALNGDGGGLYNLGDLGLTRSVFIGNRAAGSGGALNNGARSATLVNCLATGNSAARYGGAAYATGSRITLTNCTFADNYATNGNALACDSFRKSSPSTLTLANSILWDGGSAIWNNDSSTITITCSDVQAGWQGTGNLIVDPCFAKPGYWVAPSDPNRIVEPNDPNASWVAGDYHLKSQAGRWQPSTQTWVLDQVTSLCIDAGKLTDPVGLEPFPNGGIVNMGAYGGTAEASKSYFGQPTCQAVVAGDLNGDCKVDFADLRLLGVHWLEDHNEKVHIKWLGQAAVKIWTSTVVIYVDPYRLTTSPQDATLLLITHSHSDHYSPTDIARVSTSATQLIGPSSVITAAGKGTLILPGQTIDIGSVRITGVAAYNANHSKSNNWVGFIVEILGKRVFCAGDTSMTTELKAVVGMDVAFLPIDGVYNMGPAVAAEATIYMQPKLAIPYHWGTADAQTFAKLAACPVKIMKVGEDEMSL